MIDAEVLNMVKSGVCAVAYLTVPGKVYVKQKLRPWIKVVGTGFLVREGVVMTNRHVIEALLHYQADLGFPDDQRILLFGVPHGQSSWMVGVTEINQLGVIVDEEYDVGLIDFVMRSEPEFQAVQPLSFHADFDYQVTQSVGLCGYPYGHSMLHKGGKVYRWGPVVQQGFISAISPFDTATRPNELLLDVRIAKGMSGAPIFRPSDGTVIGIVHSFWEAATALGLPLTTSVVESWLKQHDSDTE